MIVEEGKLSMRAMLGVITLIVIFCGVAVLVVSLLLELRYEPPALHTAAEFKGPLLEVEEGEVLKRVRLRETLMLEGYGWVDQERGIGRIPVDRAMELMLARSSTRAQGGSAP
jgi:hypothetical protein